MSNEKFYATGRRKESTARVWIEKGTGVVTINERPVAHYMQREVLQMRVIQPLNAVEKAAEYNVKATVSGGGLSGQAGALLHGIARALVLENPEYRAVLKKAGMLTRDAREVERKKYGRAGARKKFQYSKR